MPEDVGELPQENWLLGTRALRAVLMQRLLKSCQKTDLFSQSP